jgi:dolichyl-phosphate beta-glucosyltransferase
MLAARGDYVLFMDADMSTSIEELDKLLPHFREGYDIVIGSRKVSGAKIDTPQPKYREIMGKTFSYLSRIMTVRSIHDFTCGFKCFRKSCIRKVFERQRLNGWGYDTEILFIADRQGFSLKEVPVVWSDSADSRVRLWRDVFRSALDLISIRWNSLLGRYR